MQVRAIVLWAARTYQRPLVRRQLNQVAGDKARRKSQVSKNLHQQPCRISARPHALFKRLFAGLDARFHPRPIANFVAYRSIQVDQEGDRPTLLARKLLKKLLEAGASRINRAIRFEILSQLRRVIERVVFDPRLQEEIEWVEGR